jgi:hypothetical protein
LAPDKEVVIIEEPIFKGITCKKQNSCEIYITKALILVLITEHSMSKIKVTSTSSKQNGCP